jgi:succinoglycan biosynthesis protein ExoA
VNAHDDTLDDDLVTVVVPARNEEASIGECLRSILAQDEHRLQVVVVDGESDDATAEIVRELREHDPRVELVRNPHRLIPHALNIGLAHARGSWLVRVDAHSTVEADYVRRLVDQLRSGGWGGVGARKDAVGTTPAGRAIAFALGSRFGVGDSHYHHATTSMVVEHIPFGAYPTRLLRELGGWDETFAVNEDFELDQRIRATGRELLLDPSVRIAWTCKQSIADLFRQYRRYGRGKADVMIAHPGATRPRHLVPPAFVLALASVLVLRRRDAAAAVLVPYAGAMALATVQGARDLPAASRGHLPGAFATMHVAWGIGVWEGLLRRAIAALYGRRGPD